MAILVHNLTLGLDEPQARLAAKAARKLGVAPEAILSLQIARRSFDARPRRVRWVYSVVLSLREEESAVLRRTRAAQVEQYRPAEAPRVEPGPERTDPDAPPLVVGAGPAGLFAAGLLARAGYRPLVLDRGQAVDRRDRDVAQYVQTRRLNPESNLLFGEGGAGTYSDGKLYTRSHRGLEAWVVGEFARFSGLEDLAVSGRPHIGSDVLPDVSSRMRLEIESAGGVVRYGACVDGLELADGRVRAVRLRGGERLEVSCVLLGIGHSARDTYRMLRASGVSLSARAFQLGVRIEHPQELIDRAQLGRHADRPELVPTDYTLVARGAGGDRDLYTFCMCPGGRVLPANNQESTICTNGGSRRARDSGWANSALVATVQPEEFGGDPLEGLAMQERIERASFQAAGGDYSLAAQRAVDFLAGRTGAGAIATSSLTGARACDFAQLLPEPICRALATALPQFDRKLPGFAGPSAVLLGPETRASAPVRIDRDSRSRASVSAENLYPIGEGAGYAGGIVSAAVDSLRSAEAVIARYAPPR